MAAWMALLIFASAAWCQDELTLDQAVSLAIQNNRAIRSARLEVAKSQNALAAARTYRLPSFRFNMFEFQPLTHINLDIPGGSLGSPAATGPIPPVNTSIGSPLLPITLVLGGVDQPLSQLHRIGLNIQLQDLNRQMTAQRLAAQEQGIANDVKAAYLGLVQTESALRGLEEALKLLHELERVAGESLSQQTALRADLLEVQVRLAQAEFDQLRLRDSIHTQQAQLNVLLGRSSDTDFHVTPATEATDLKIDPMKARTRALDQRPELREAHLAVLQAEKDRSIKKSEYIPDVSLSVDYLALGNIKFLPANTLVAGVSVNWNVFDWGRKKFELAAKDETIEQAKLALMEMEAQILLDVDAHIRKLEESRAHLKVTDLARQVAAERLRVAINKMEEHAVQIKEVLQAQSTLADANVQYERDLLAFGAARAEFEKALGER
jgi:outer membrane protein